MMTIKHERVVINFDKTTGTIGQITLLGKKSDYGVIDLNEIPEMEDAKSIEECSIKINLKNEHITINKFVLPDKIHTVPPRIFAKSGNQVEIKEFVWPKACMSIPPCCLRGCHIGKLSNIDHVVSVDASAFEDTCIEEMRWPSNCKTIPSSCFYMSTIGKIENLEHVSIIEDGAFSKCFIKRFDIPQNVTYIPHNCFANSTLEEITGTEHLKGIGPSAFMHCRLASFDWPSKCKIVPAACFSATVTLSKVTNLKNVTSVGKDAFFGTAIREAEFSEKLEEIGADAFHGSKLERISGIRNVKEVGEFAFAEIKSFKGAFEWPEKCGTIKEYTFFASKLEDLTGLDKVISIGTHAFERTTVPIIDLSSSICLKIAKKAFNNAEIKEIRLGYYSTDIDETAFSSTNARILK